ncbi:hypothetical protein [Terrabacter sp. Soil810]|uniref:hypothetical protein n=2 Tax=unclassified Terrabacter TaxID=2630222 RepID=UPI0006FC2A10|nr:hypothetical protein [Terrabacter sp. Soil810]KRB47104.1 hypothetical protein ASD90_01605 [Terrabacter sp. Root181]KRF38911.1 hypothetical protein ASG96_16180 [Terrabacter sp. Soil810]
MPEPMDDHMTTNPPDRTRWRWTAVLALSVVASAPLSLAACSSARQSGATPTLTTVTVTHTPAPRPVSTPPSTTSTPTSTLGQLEGTWQSLDQGSAEVLYTFRPDGRFERAEVLMQSRSSGTFEFAIGTKGVVEVTGSTLTLKPQGGVQTLHDPDSPSGSYDGRPLDDLSPETYSWSRQGEDLVLVGKFGAVTYEPVTQEPPR